ncbi:MAG: helix-turn-helix domain-containing protein [Lacunisphaera sp.]
MPKKSLPPADRILAQALKEFSARGYSGARVERIARLARVNKRMLFYYFGDKESLFHAVLESAWRNGDVLKEAPDDPAESLLFWRDFYFRNESWVRLLLWEGLELRKPRALEQRQAFWDASVARRRRLAGPGGWARSLDARQLLLAEIGLLIAPLALPHITKLIFGHDAREPAFQQEHAEFLRRLAGVLTETGRSPKT